MKKRVVAVLIAAALSAMTVTAWAEENVKETETAIEETEAEVEEAVEEENAADAEAEKIDFGVEPEFEPNEDYDKYTVIEYTIEALNADIIATISAKEDNSEFEILCNFFGEDQMAVVTYDGETFECIEDKTGFLNGDAPDILKTALEKDLWAPLGEAAGAEGEAASFDLSALDYQPKEGYDYFTVTDFDIDSLGQTLEIVVSKKEGDKEYNLQMSFFGGDADVDVTIDDNGNYTVTNDGGFFQTEGPLVVEQVEEEDNWAPIE